MRRYLVIHISLLVSFFILISLFKRFLDLSFLPFWIGGVIGFVLPDLDYAIYHYFLRTSTTPSVDTVVSDVTSENVFKNWTTVAEEREDKKLVFHTAIFVLIFFVFAFFVMSSSNSLLGRGIVLSFWLHLLVDMVTDWRYKGSISHWFINFPLELDLRQKMWFLYIQIALLLILGFFF